LTDLTKLVAVVVVVAFERGWGWVVGREWQAVPLASQHLHTQTFQNQNQVQEQILQLILVH
jgi:hypothetical protein